MRPVQYWHDLRVRECLPILNLMSDETKKRGLIGRYPLAPDPDPIPVVAKFRAKEDAGNVLRESKERFINEGAKGLMLVNGAGAVALLAFLQSIWGQDGGAALADWVLAGTAVLVLGVALAASIFMFRHRAFVKGAHDETFQLYRWAHWWVPGASIACFVIGVGLAICGGLFYSP